MIQPATLFDNTHLLWLMRILTQAQAGQNHPHSHARIYANQEETNVYVCTTTTGAQTFRCAHSWQAGTHTNADFTHPCTQQPGV